jgi:4-hydroxy-tetrahydrodipicolinate reductase
MKNKINIAVFGAGGRMGQEIAKSVRDYGNLVPALGIDRLGKCEGFKLIRKELDSKDFKSIDVLIDFSAAAAFSSVVKFCKDNQIKLVSGTTGISEKDRKALAAAAKKTAVLWAPNMSLGVATLEKALEALSSLKHFDFQIEETHHRYKKDKPSGTGLLLQKKLESVVGRKLQEPLAIRGGGVFGVHQIHVLGESETLVFEHRALNRRLFADGAVAAAAWMAKQKPGLYELKDILNK